jgi:lysophospholipase L1-like esterase
MITQDGIHPNGDGYQVIAKNVLPTLLPLLGK